MGLSLRALKVCLLTQRSLSSAPTGQVDQGDFHLEGVLSGVVQLGKFDHKVEGQFVHVDPLEKNNELKFSRTERISLTSYFAR
jgi:hypothetical protein